MGGLGVFGLWLFLAVVVVVATALAVGMIWSRVAFSRILLPKKTTRH